VKDNLDKSPWWHWGLAFGGVLALMMVHNVVIALLTQPVPMEALILLPALFGIGFVCGSAVGWLRFLSDRFGLAGDAARGTNLCGNAVYRSLLAVV
jgi:hypothetical protein